MAKQYMAIQHKDPTPLLRIRSADEISPSDNHYEARGLPVSRDNRLLLASWNIANFVQERSKGASKILAHTIKRCHQFAFAPTALENRVVEHGIFDFDAVVFASKGKAFAKTRRHERTVKAFNPSMWLYLSAQPHMWVEL